MRVLVTGATGLLGATLVPRWREAGWEVVTHGRHRAADVNADFSEAGAVRAALDQVAPDAVLNLAALSDVDACEAAPEVAAGINHHAVEHLAEWWRENPGMRLVHVGTDQVYSRPGPSREDETVPVNEYGRTKLAGDLAAAAAGATVVRTNFFGPGRHPARMSQSDWFLQAFRSGEPFTIFTDITFSPLRMETVSDLLARVLGDPPAGVFNLGAREPMTKHDFARALAQRYGFDTSPARSGEGASVPGRAPRPPDTSMDPARLEEALGVRLPTLVEEIQALP